MGNSDGVRTNGRRSRHSRGQWHDWRVYMECLGGTLEGASEERHGWGSEVLLWACGSSAVQMVNRVGLGE